MPLILICGRYLSGKSVGACTFPKPMLYSDWDGNFSSIQNTKNKKGELVVPDWKEIEVVPFFKNDIYPLDFKTENAGAPLYTIESPVFIIKHNNIVKQLKVDGKYEGKGPFQSWVIDSATSMFQIWTEAVMRMNNQATLRIQDWGTLGEVLLGQFIPSLRTILAGGIVKWIIVVDHTMLEKDEVSGRLEEFPIGPTRNLGKNIGRKFDEVFLMESVGDSYRWRTRPAGLFQAGSRSNLPDPVEPATFKRLLELKEGVKKI